MTIFIRLLILFLCVTLMSCSYISKPFSQNGHTDYMKAQSIPPLKMPSGVASNGFQNYYPVSDRTYPKSAVDVSIIPPGLNDKN